jgi:hypothetical protein
MPARVAQTPQDLVRHNEAPDDGDEPSDDEALFKQVSRRLG